MITSNRKFGFEVEFFCKDKKSLYRIGESLKLIDDGSIRHIPYSAEYVSPVLQGKSGENTVQKACEVIKKGGGSGDNPAMSIHIHLDGGRGHRDMQASVEKPNSHKQIVRVSDKLARILPEGAIFEYLKTGYLNVSGYNIQNTQFENVLNFSLARLLKKPEKNFTYYYISEKDRFKWLRNMMYFYVQYSQVMEDIVSNSRKYGNMYCIPIGDSYELEDIEACQTEEDLKSVWYKGREPSGHYDDSRYHNVNFHCYWDRHGTVEMRSHGGTVEANKILLWLKLHQKIADKLEDMELEDIRLEQKGKLHKSFIEFVEEPILQSYVKRLLGYYSGITIK